MTSTAAPRILLVRLSAIGDCLHAIPVLAALRKHFPRAFIGWALEKGPMSLLEGHPLVDRFHLFPRHLFKRREGSFWTRLGALWKFRAELRAARYETAIDLQGLAKSGLVAWWSRASQRVGFRGEDSREGNALFLNRRVTPPAAAGHVVERNLALLSVLGVPVPAPLPWVLPLYRKERREMDRFLGQCGLLEEGRPRPFAIVNPGATWRTKRWPPEHFGKAAWGLASARKLPVVITWAGEAEKRAAETILQIAHGPRVFIAPPTNLRQLAALSGRAALFVGNDTGPLHLAVALGVPSVAVFGASDPKRNGPYGAAHRVLAGSPECQPCWKTTCARGDLACLMRVSPTQILACCDELLGRQEPAPPAPPAPREEEARRTAPR